MSDKENGALTLCGGARTAKFARLTVARQERVTTLQQTEPRRILAAFPDLAEREGKGEAFTGHPDYARYNSRLMTFVSYYPWIVGAWDAGEPPTPDDIDASDVEELFDCLHEIARLSPSRLWLMPAVIQDSHDYWLADRERKKAGQSPDFPTASRAGEKPAPN